MRRNTPQDIRWFRRYKTIAVIGMAAVVAVPVEWVTMSMMDGWYSLVAAVLCIVGLGTGYLIEHLAMKISRYRESYEIDFTYEYKIRIPRGLTFVCWLITSILMIALAVGLVNLINGFRIKTVGESMSRDALLIYGLELGLIMTVAGCIGAYLRPFAFYQIVGLRSLVECITVFAFVGGMEFAYSRFATVSFFFVSCMLTYIVCMAIVMNQVHVIQPSYFSPTCHATDELRRAGLRDVRYMLGLCFRYAWFILAGMSLLAFPFRVLMYKSGIPAFYWLFAFPFWGYPVINLIIFIFSLLTLIALILYLCLRVKHPGIDAKLGDVKHFLRLVGNWIEKLLQKIRLAFKLMMLTNAGELRKRRKTDQKEETEDIKLTYEDTVIVRHRPRPLNEPVISYGTFSRRVLSQPNIKAQYAYAYRTLVGCLRRKYIGIDEHTTPQNIADIVKKRTNIKNIDRITELFYASSYAPEAPAPTVNELVALCDVVRAELERERKANQ